MNAEQVNCQNCEKLYKDGFEFCPHCGQKTNEELTIGVLFYNTISNYFSFDARFIKSFIPLMFKPGYLAKEFIKGKRLLFLHPAQMYLFVAVIFFFIFNFYVRDSREEIDKSMQKVVSNRAEKSQKRMDSITLDSIDAIKLLKPIRDNSDILGLEEKDLKAIDSLSKIKMPKDNFNTSFSFDEKVIDSLITSGASSEIIYKAMGMKNDDGYFRRKMYMQGLKFYKTMGVSKVLQTFTDSIPLAMFFLLPIFAFLLKLFFFKKGRYAHHLVFSFYYFSFLFAVLSIIFGINRLRDIPDLVDWLVASSTFFYLIFAIIKFYHQHWLLSFIKSSVISFLFLMIVLPFSFTILAIIAFLFY